MIRTKLLLLVAASAVLATLEAVAQDAAAPFRRDSPTPGTEPPAAESTPAPTAVPEETPPPPPASTPTSTPSAASESASPAEKSSAPASATPGGRVIQEKPVRAIERRPAGSRESSATPSAPERRSLPPASRPTFDFSEAGGNYIAATVRTLENRWQGAVVKHDAGVIDELVADDFIGTSSTGKMGSKSTLLYEVKRDENTYKSATARGLVVRSFGPGVAVVAGVAKETGTTPDGQRFSNARRFTDTWVLREGRWQCVASHATQLPKN